jgi:hypothetical protein
MEPEEKKEPGATPAGGSPEPKPEEKPNERPEPATLEEAKAELERAREALKAANKEAKDRRLKLDEIEAEKQREAQERKKQDEESARKKGEFETLATTYQGERDAARDELKSANEKLARYNELFSADIETRIKSWPDEVKVLVPKAEDADALARYERVMELMPLAEKLLGAPAKPGIAPAPGTAVSGAMTGDVRKEKRANGAYRV